MIHTPLLLLVAALHLQAETATWRYPNLGPGSSGIVKAGGKDIGQSFSEQTQDDFAKVLAWYGKRAGCSGPTDALKGFRDRKPTEAPTWTGSDDSVVAANGDTTLASSAVYSFTDQHMHVTFLIPEPKRNRIVTISVASNGKLTTVNALMSKM